MMKFKVVDNRSGKVLLQISGSWAIEAYADLVRHFFADHDEVKVFSSDDNFKTSYCTAEFTRQ